MSDPKTCKTCKCSDCDACDDCRWACLSCEGKSAHKDFCSLFALDLGKDMEESNNATD